MSASSESLTRLKWYLRMTFVDGIKKIISFFNDGQVRLLTPLTVRLLLPHIYPGERVLDIGSGLGFQAELIRKKTGNEIEGIDVVDYGKTKIPYKHFDGVNIPHPDKSFDVSYLAFVLHHAEKPMELLAEAMRVTKKRIIILEDTPKNIFDRGFDAYHGWSFNKFFKLKHKAVFRTKEIWDDIFAGLPLKRVESIRLSRLSREPYFPISRTKFILELR